MTITEDVENLRKEQIKLSDDVTNLEAEHDYVTEKLNIVDGYLDKVKMEIDDSVNDNVNIVNESDKDSQKRKENNRNSTEKATVLKQKIVNSTTLIKSAKYILSYLLASSMSRKTSKIMSICRLMF